MVFCEKLDGLKLVKISFFYRKVNDLKLEKILLIYKKIKRKISQLDIIKHFLSYFTAHGLCFFNASN